ncbi:MAG: hypothetical protein LBF16_15155 [Pseudomonadales bacterium]|jgi:hypothetical protein|nr:hypothetical protein [Pseudomonadales bacterium]
MNATDTQLHALRQRLARNLCLCAQGALAGEREQLQRDVAQPLLGLAFLLGLVAGSGHKAIYALHKPWVLNAVRMVSSLVSWQHV